MEKIVIGVDPHKLSATIEVVNRHEKVLASGRFTTDKAGYAAMRRHVASWPDRVMEAMRCLKRRISDALYRQLSLMPEQPARAREGTAGRL